MSTYAGQSVNDFDVTTPTEGTAPPSEYNDAIREIKTVIKNSNAIVSKSANYTLTPQDTVVLVTLGSKLMTLPQASTVSSTAFMRTYIIKNVSGGGIVIAAYTGETIDGYNKINLAPNEVAILLCNGGTTWRRIGGDRNYASLSDSFVFYEDFVSDDLGVSPGTGITYRHAHVWYRKGYGANLAGVHGVINVSGDGTTAGLLQLRTDANNNFCFDETKRLEFFARWAQYGAAVATRYIGLQGNNITDATLPPANGIYFRHTMNGNIIAVCRAGGVETALDTLVGAYSGEFNQCSLRRVADVSAVEVMVNDVYKGTITTNIPLVKLNPFAADDSVAIDTGLSIDYFHIRQNR